MSLVIGNTHDPALWLQVQNIFELAVNLPADEQMRFVRKACGENEALVEEVQTLLDTFADAERELEDIPDIRLTDADEQF